MTIRYSRSPIRIVSSVEQGHVLISAVKLILAALPFLLVTPICGHSRLTNNQRQSDSPANQSVHSRRTEDYNLLLLTRGPQQFNGTQVGRLSSLQLDSPVERELKGGESHSYVISLAPGHYVRLLLDQRGIDVVVRLFSKNEKLLEVDRPNGSFGSEELVWIAPTKESYRLEIRALEETASPGKYALRIAELRPSTDQDRKRLLAQAAYNRGLSLRSQVNGSALEAIKSFTEALKLGLSTEHLSVAAYAANGLGDAYRDSGDFQKASELYQKAASLHKSVQDRGGESLTINNLGTLNLNRGDPRTALAYFQESLKLQKEIGNRRSESFTTNDIGRAYNRLGDRAKALEYYQAALVLERALKDQLSEAATLSNMAEVYSNLGDLAKALDHYRQAQLLYRELKDESGEAGVGNGIGVVYLNRGEYQNALKFFNAAIETLKKTGDQRSMAVALNNAGEAYLYLKENEKGLEIYQQALTIHRQLHDRYGEATALHGIGSAYVEMFRHQEGLEYLLQALELRKQIQDRSGETTTAFSLGVLYWDMREYQKSLNYTFRALENFRQLRDPLGEVQALYHIGWVYFSMDESRKAAEYLTQALEGYRKLGHRSGEIVTLDTLSRAWNNAGELRRALECVQQKLALLNDTKNQAAIAQATGIIGILYAQLDEPQPAIEYLQRALRLNREINNRREEAICLNGIGWLYSTLKDAQQATQYYEQSLSIWRSLKNTDWQADVLYNLAELKASSGAWKEAAAFLDESLNLAESKLSIELLAGGEWQKQFFLRSQNKNLQIAIGINHRYAPNDTKTTELALTTILRRKGRILDAMSNEISALRQNASAETITLLDQINHQASVQSQLKIRGPQGMSLQDYQSQLNESQEKIEELQLKVNASSSRIRSETQAVTSQLVQALIPRDSALVEFMVWLPFQPEGDWRNKFGKPRYVAYVMFNQGPAKLIDLGDAQTINTLARKLRSVLRDPTAEVSVIKETARAMDELVMKPIRQKLGTTRRMLISPDGELNLVPFAALIDERGDYLVTNYKISYLTSGRDLLRLQIPRQSKEPPLIVANPDFEDTGTVSAANPTRAGDARSTALKEMKWGPLPGTDSEAKAIKNLMPDAKLRTGGDATETEVKKVQAPVIIHFATHGFFLTDVRVDDQPLVGTLRSSATAGLAKEENRMLRSGLVLAGANPKQSGDQDGVLTALEMAGLNLWGTKLVVLSACETGIGDVQVGEGVYGLRRALVLAGAEAQIMSLWKVDDKVTANLMRDYYSILLTKNAGRADALRDVQLLLLRNKETSHPYFWAGFIESGAWDKMSAGGAGRN